MTAIPRRPRKWQKRSYLLGFGVGLIALGVLLFPSQERLHAKGPMNVGHGDLRCIACHRPAPGTPRQQIQANLRFIMGMRKTPADFGRRPVVNEVCLDCHERPNDRHPVYRFLEPRFAKARVSPGAHRCVSCHAEHQGRRVTLAEVGYCVACHEDTKLRKDPIDVAHDRLIALKLWESCLGCHDFHGNHVRKTANTVDQRILPEKLRTYFEGGASPYGAERYHKARKEVSDG